MITLIGIYLAVAYEQKVIAIIFSLGFVLFIYLVRVHAGLENKKEWNQTLVNINLKELKLLDGCTEGMDAGTEFLHSSHNYNEDLDIFGNRSLFQLINRTATAYGRIALAKRLSNPITDIDILKARQNAIYELRDKPDWRQNFQAIGNIFNEKKKI